MKKTIALLMAAVVATSIPVYAGEEDLLARIEALEERVAALEAKAGAAPEGVSEVQDKEPGEVSVNNVATDMVAKGCSLEYKRYEIGQDYKGNDAVIMYFDFTNESGETVASAYEFYVKVFQNGREQELATISGNEAVENKRTEFRTGADTVEVAYASLITDRSDIIVNISSMSELFAEDVEFTVSLE